MLRDMRWVSYGIIAHVFKGSVLPASRSSKLDFMASSASECLWSVDVDEAELASELVLLAGLPHRNVQAASLDCICVQLCVQPIPSPGAGWAF